MDRDLDPRDDGRERPGLDRSGRGPSVGVEVRHLDPREVFAHDLDLPRGRSRERVLAHGHTYSLRGSEVRTLATVGAFRVVPTEDLREVAGGRSDARTGDLFRLREGGLIRTIPHGVGRHRTTLVVLTERGRDVLEGHRSPTRGRSQTFYAGLVKPREVPHDSHAYRAYLRTADRLVSEGVAIRRVVLDYELKRDYQRFLQQRNRTRRHAEAAAEQELRTVDEWARAYDLPVNDGHVQFPDVRIEFERPDGRRDVEDVEVVTAHYRGALAAAKAASGFTCYRSGGRGHIGGRSGRAGGRPMDPRIAEEFLS
jgi:DNA-binding MarR family transcriptional regulator